MSELLRYNKEQKYICWDFETCNLNIQSLDNKPWQLSYIVAQNNQILEESDNYIWWEDLKISEDAARITHFDYNKYKRLAQDPLPILNKFEEKLFDPEYRLVGQNLIQFDVYILQIYRRLMGLQPNYKFIERIIDTMCLAKAVKKGIKINKEDDLTCLMYKLAHLHEKGLKTSIATQLKEQKIDHDPMMLHNSLYDVRMNWEIFKRQIWQIEI